MLSIYDNETAAAVLSQPLDPELRTLLEGRLSDAAALGLADLTHLVVIQPGDTETMIQDEIGWSPLVHPIDEIRFGKAGFTPYWSWIEDLGRWYELVHPVGNDGFAYVLLVEQTEAKSDSILRMCREFSGIDP